MGFCTRKMYKLFWIDSVKYQLKKFFFEQNYSASIDPELADDKQHRMNVWPSDYGNKKYI